VHLCVIVTFDRQQALFHVLGAYSMYNTEIGYCQGMSQIAALLLMYLNEEVCTHCSDVMLYIWMAPWKNQICSTTMKWRKSLVKPVTRQNMSSCLVLPPEIVMADGFNFILWMSADTCVVVHDDLGLKNQTTLYNCRFSATSLALRVIFIRQKTSADICVVHDDLGWKNWTTCCYNRFWGAGCSWLEYVDIRLVY